jgi:hypothetical protein
MDSKPRGLFDVTFTYTRNVLKLALKVKTNHQTHVTSGAAAERAAMMLDSNSVTHGTRHNTPTVDPK